MEENFYKISTITLMIVVVIMVFILFINKPFYDIVYDNGEKCNLILEQRIGCYKGCQHAFGYLEEPPKVTNPADYFDCTRDCDNHYYLEFKVDGSIKYCEYLRNYN